MAFPDTVTFTINSVAKTLNRINQDSYSSEYFLRSTTDEFRAKIRQSTYVAKNGKTVDRHNVELIQTVYAVAPATLTTVRKSYCVFENERADGITDPLNFDVGFVGFLTSANITKLINYES